VACACLCDHSTCSRFGDCGCPQLRQDWKQHCCCGSEPYLIWTNSCWDGNHAHGSAGGDAPLTVRFDSTGKYGSIDKTLSVFVTGQSDPIEVGLRGQTYTEIALSPNPVDFGSIRIGRSRVVKATLARTDGRPLHVARVELPGDLHAKVEYSSSGSASLSIQVAAGQLPGNETKNAIVWTDDAAQPEIQVPVCGVITGEYGCSPSVVNFGLVHPNEEVSKTISVTGPEAAQIRIGGLPKDVQASILHSSDDRSVIRVSYRSKGGMRTILNDHVVLYTPSNKQPSILLPVLAAGSDPS